MSTSSKLKHSPEALDLKNHSLLQRMRDSSLDRDQVCTILGQWYHPLHYFPNFLSRHIVLSPTLEAKAHVSRIVWQELGEGDPRQAHEAIYVRTMEAVGFSPSEFVDVDPLPATKTLVDEFADKSGSNYAASLGYLFATEAADLAMVAAIGAAVRNLTGATELQWVDIHVKQEPDHTDSVDSVLRQGLSLAEEVAVTEHTGHMFRYWSNFFSDIEARVDGQGAAAPARHLTSAA